MKRGKERGLRVGSFQLPYLVKREALAISGDDLEEGDLVRFCSKGQGNSRAGLSPAWG